MALFVVFITLAAFLMFSDDIGLRLGIRNAAICAAGTGLGAGLLALALLMIAPARRQALDTAAITALLFAAVLVQIPGVSFTDAAQAVMTFAGFLIAAALIHSLLYGDWSDRLLTLPRQVERATATTTLPRARVWAALVPAPQDVQAYWDPTVVEISRAEDDADALLLFHRFPDGKVMEQVVRFDEITYGKSFRYFYATLGARQRGPESLAAVLEQRDAAIALHLRWERADYPLRLGLMHWIDDWGGRTVDRMLLRLEAEARREAAGPTLQPA